MVFFSFTPLTFFFEIAIMISIGGISTSGIKKLAASVVAKEGKYVKPEGPIWGSPQLENCVKKP